MSEWSLREEVTYEERLSRELVAVRPPKRYSAILLNDDYTPMDFVVRVLIRFFGHAVPRAIELMLQVHQCGRAVCGVFSRDVAETKVSQVNDFSRAHDYPLLCIMEPLLQDPD